MKYFSVPICPYCRKRVNLIRTWSLKRQGEYRCPRCGGISNIYLSPLIYVFGLLAVVSGGAMYFFHKFVLDDVSLGTVIQVIVPFAAFFLLSLFMVYLEKPVIKKVPKAELDRRRRKAAREEARQGRDRAQSMFYEEDEYLPKADYRTGPLPAQESELDRTHEVRLPRMTAGGEPVARRPVRSAEPFVESSRPQAANVENPSAAAGGEPVARRPVRSAEPFVESSRPQAANVENSSAAAEPLSNEDFFAKYDDPAYVERRLRELKEQRGEDV